MPGVEISKKADITVKQEAAAKIRNMVRGMVTSKASADIRDQIAVLLDEGGLAQDNGPLTCVNCKHSYNSEEESCPYCGTVTGEENKEAGTNIEEDDGFDPEIPVHGEMSEDNYYDIPAEVDLSEHFKGILDHLGWDTKDAEIGGLILARVWETEKKCPTDVSGFQTALVEVDAGIKDKLLQDDVTEQVLLEFKKLVEKEDVDKQNSIQCDIRIYKDNGGEWMVEVDDPLQDINIKNGSEVVWINEKLKFSINKWVEIIENRKNQLKKLGDKLLDMRKDFFEATDPETAINILSSIPLTQKEVAKAADIPKTTLSNWCQNDKFLISTPHGIYPLNSLFNRKGTRTGYKLKKKTTTKQA